MFTSQPQISYIIKLTFYCFFGGYFIIKYKIIHFCEHQSSMNFYGQTIVESFHKHMPLTLGLKLSQGQLCGLPVS